jgi:ferrous iron transport protein A
MLQLSGNRRSGGPVRRPRPRATLVDLRRGEQGILESLDLPEDEARRLMELGFIPGSPVTVGRSAPGGDPRVFQVDGSEVALRRETARKMHILRRVPDGGM